MSRHRKLCHDKVEKLQVKNVCRDIYRVCRDTKFSLNSASQLDWVTIEENYVADKDEEERIEDWSSIKKSMSRQFSEAEKYKKLVATYFMS